MEMDKYLQIIDSYIKKIPVHIRDLIQKGFFMLLAIAGLVAIITGVRRGIDDAEPGGAKLFQKSEDFFYLEKIREENKKKNRIIEDIEVYKDLFEAREENNHPTFRTLGKDTEDRLIGDREEFLKEPDKLRRKQHDFLIEDDKSLEYEKPLPDSETSGDLDRLPFIEKDKQMLEDAAVPTETQRQPTADEKKSLRIDNPDKLEFLE